MMIKRLFITVFLFTGLVSYGQRMSTFENWFSAAVEKKSNDFTFKFDQGWRIREMYMSRQNYSDLSVDYKINKYFNVAAGYRLILKNHLFNVNELNNRFYFDFNGNYDLDFMDLSFRSKFQYTQSGQEDDISVGSENCFRNRFKAKFKLGDDFSLATAYEMLLIISPSATLINENRLSVDLGYKINKKNSISLGYVLRNYIQVEDPLNVHVLSLEYVFKL